jgi:hypothetical protein
VIEGEVKLRCFFKGNRKIHLSLNEDLQLGHEAEDERGSVNHSMQSFER